MAKTKKKAAKKMTSKKKAAGIKPVPVGKLRWHCTPELMHFADTSELEPLTDVAVQQSAIKAMRFGLEAKMPGHNIYVRGMLGTNRLPLVRLLCEELRHTHPPLKDYCYVRNFHQPDQPRLIILPPGRGWAFQESLDELCAFLRTELGPILSSDVMRSSRETLKQTAKAEIEKVIKPLEIDLRSVDLALVSYESGPAAQAAIFHMVDGKPVPPEEFEGLHAMGNISSEQYEAATQIKQTFTNQLEEVNRKATEIRHDYQEKVKKLMERTARWVLKNSITEIEELFPIDSVKIFLEELVDDLIRHRLEGDQESGDFTRNYRVNVVHAHDDGEDCPIIAESATTLRSLLGTIDYEFGPGGEGRASHMGIKAGNLLRADGGFLIIDVRDLFSDGEVWKTLVRTLRTGKVEIVPLSVTGDRMGPSIQPEPIPVNLKVVLIGDSETYYLFDQGDKDFSHLFKVVVDFHNAIPRDEKGIRLYAQALARVGKLQGLPPFDPSAVAAMAEEGARYSGQGGMLTTCFDRISDLAGEAAGIAMKEKRINVNGDDIRLAVQQSRERCDLPARLFRRRVAEGTVRVETRGEVVGQINGLAVMMTGMVTYGFPARITATIGPGTAGVINIEREATLSGAIHTKGFYILGGLLRYLLRTDHPLAFDASVAFEQSYGGIDGDSASGAEVCCLLSALTDVPLRQDVAMTGAIDQVGHILAVGAVNDKIEGFFDVCSETGLTGKQAVIIPASNAADLMLRDDVVKACASRKFRVYAVETVHEALEILTGMPAGVRGKTGAYPRNSLLGKSVLRAREYWIKASRRTTR